MTFTGTGTKTTQTYSLRAHSPRKWIAAGVVALAATAFAAAPATAYDGANHGGSGHASSGGHVSGARSAPTSAGRFNGGARGGFGGGHFAGGARFGGGYRGPVGHGYYGHGGYWGGGFGYGYWPASLGFGYYYNSALAWPYLGLAAWDFAAYNDLTETQLRAQQNAMVQATTAPTGSAITWADGGDSGAVTPVRDGRTADGRQCREFEQQIKVGGQTQSAYGTACQQPDGSWQIVSNAS